MSTSVRRGELGNGALVAIVATCGLSYLFDGYDLIVYGATVPSLTKEWGLGPGQAGAIGSYALVGMLVGALVVGSVTDLLGRRRVLIAAVAWFSVGTASCALADGPTLFGVLRFASGLGLGAVLPTLNALLIEYAPERKRNMTYAVMAIGYPLGGILASALAIPLIPAVGWQVMYLIGAAPILLVLPLALRALPESLEFLVARGRLDEAHRLAARLGVELAPAREPKARTGRRGSLAGLVGKGYLMPTLLFWAASFCSLLAIYGMSTWLPQLMREAGYPLQSALSFLLVFNIGAIVGLFFGGRAADRFGAKPAVVLGFALACAAVLLLAGGGAEAVVYVLVAVAGYGTIGTQTLLNAFVTGYYPAESRAAGIAWTLGVGRLGGILGPTIAGALLDAHASLTVLFGLFAAVAGVGGAVVCLVRPQKDDAPALAPDLRQADRV
ncbi:MFS transporter [Streptomyces tendae]